MLIDRINKRNFKLVLFIFIPGVLFLESCNKTEDKPVNSAGKISFAFEHRIDGQKIIFDQMNYTNEAGNQYLVNEIQYFISDVTLHQGSEKILLDSWEDIHYVDTDITSTHQYQIPDDVPAGFYDKISFTFGINEEKNQSLMFVNPPESLMFWPEILGGGYHYMKLNGKWLDSLNQVSPFNFHLGIGQLYYSFPDSVSAFVQNYFEVILPQSSFDLGAGQSLTFNLVMNVEKWFASPNTFNHNQWGGDIMQKQDAMRLACENGWDVFTLEK